MTKSRLGLMCCTAEELGLTEVLREVSAVAEFLDSASLLEQPKLRRYLQGRWSLLRGKVERVLLGRQNTHCRACRSLVHCATRASQLPSIEVLHKGQLLMQRQHKIDVALHCREG